MSRYSNADILGLPFKSNPVDSGDPESDDPKDRLAVFYICVQ